VKEEVFKLCARADIFVCQLGHTGFSDFPKTCC